MYQHLKAISEGDNINIIQNLSLFFDFQHLSFAEIIFFLFSLKIMQFFVYFFNASYLEHLQKRELNMEIVQKALKPASLPLPILC